MKKQICILGSTGGIGTQALNIIEQHAGLYEAYCLTANNRYEELAVQTQEFKPAVVVIANEDLYEPPYRPSDDCPEVKVCVGKAALDEIVQAELIDMVLTVLAGFAGLSPTIQTIKAYKKVCLTNKEMLVVAGGLIRKLVQQYHVPILSIDSEHSAIFQSLVDENDSEIERILLTTSGGPFRTFTLEQTKSVTAADALRHPTWEMGAKITIDLATTMNKSFEVVEAKWLFGTPAEKIQVLVHPQSIVHSAVQSIDGGVKAQLGVSDVRLLTQYVLSFPRRLYLDGARSDILKRPLEFFKPGFKKFKCLVLAYGSTRQGDNMSCMVNAVNEAINEVLQQGRCTYLGMTDVTERTMEYVAFGAAPTFETYVEIGAMARRMINGLITK